MLILSFYGAGFATVPAYLKDLFGTYQVGAIHGRLLTAWSAAGVLGPLIVNAVVEAQGDVAGPSKYTVSFTIMIALLAIGFVANELIRPVDPKYFVPDSERGGVEDAGVSAGPGPTATRRCPDDRRTHRAHRRRVGLGRDPVPLRRSGRSCRTSAPLF